MNLSPTCRECAVCNVDDYEHHKARAECAGPTNLQEPITPEETARCMKAIADTFGDEPETSHAKTDGVFDAIARHHGHGEAADIAARLEKWYA